MPAPAEAMPLDYTRFDVLTFDCYGTLIDWEAGLLRALRRALPEVAADDGELLEGYGRHEAAAERPPYRSYREVVGSSLRGLAGDLGSAVSDETVAAFAASVGDWPVFPDTSDALRRLQSRYRLGVITNCDDDLFALSNARLAIDFDWVVTAEQARSYKPGHGPFALALERVDVPPERILHVAQSLYHDHVPARELGLTTVWIDRRGDRAGTGATPPASATPDAAFPSMAAFADAAGAPGA
jgi:2-haloacid dehalogenase